MRTRTIRAFLATPAGVALATAPDLRPGDSHRRQVPDRQRRRIIPPHREARPPCCTSVRTQTIAATVATVVAPSSRCSPSSASSSCSCSSPAPASSGSTCPTGSTAAPTTRRPRPGALRGAEGRDRRPSASSSTSATARRSWPSRPSRTGQVRVVDQRRLPVDQRHVERGRPRRSRRPARLRVAMDYCAEGEITSERGRTRRRPAKVRHLRAGRDLRVRRHARAHAGERRRLQAGRHPHRLPRRLRELRVRCGRESAAAAACPTEELERFSSKEYTDYVRTQLADQLRGRRVPGGGRARQDRPQRRRDQERAGRRARQLRQPARPRPPRQDLRVARHPVLRRRRGGGGGFVLASPGGKDLDNLEDVDAPRPDDA